MNLNHKESGKILDSIFKSTINIEKHNKEQIKDLISENSFKFKVLIEESDKNEKEFYLNLKKDNTEYLNGFLNKAGKEIT